MNRVGEGLSWHFLPPGTFGQRWQSRLGESTQDRNLSWNNNLGLFGLKIARDLARALMMQAALTVLLLAFLDGSGDSNHDDSVPISHFCRFLVFYRFDDPNY